jgi:hypothetical protein
VSLTCIIERDIILPTELLISLCVYAKDKQGVVLPRTKTKTKSVALSPRAN